MNSDRTETEKEDSDVEVEVVGDTKKIYVYSPVFTKEDEELYRFVSSRVQDVPENDEDSSSTISSTDSLEGASKPTTQDKSDKRSVKVHSKSGGKRDDDDDLRDSLDNSWADPPRLEEVTSTVPPLELRDVETPAKPREKKSDSHRNKGHKKKVEDAPAAKNDNQGATSPPSTTFLNPQGMPATFLPPGMFPAGPPAPNGGIVYIAGPGNFTGAGGVPFPFPFIFPNQMMPTGATVTEVQRSSDSDETLTEQPNKHKRKHHSHKQKKETRDVGEMTTPENNSRSMGNSHQTSLSSSTMQGSTALASSGSRDPYSEEDYYYEQDNKKYGNVESPNVTGLPWSGAGQDEYGDDYYEKTESDRSNNVQPGQNKIVAKPFGSNASSLPPKRVPNNLDVVPPRKMPQQPLPFRRADVDYVENNKRTYGRLKGSSYGQMLDRRNEDKSVTDMIEDERMRIRMKVEQKAAEMHRLKQGSKVTGQVYQDPQEVDEEYYYDTPYAENYNGNYPSNNTDYEEQYYSPADDSAESGWHANVEKLVYAQEKRAALRRANDAAFAKSTSAPTKGASSFGPPRPAIGPPSTTKPQAFAGNNHLMAVTEEAGPNRYRVSHELQLQNSNQGLPVKGAFGTLQQQQLQRTANFQQQFQQQQQQQFQQQQFQLQQQQFQLQQQQNMQMYDDYGLIQPQARYYQQQDISQRFPQNVRLSNSLSHQNLNQIGYGGQFGGNVPYAVGQAADWPLMSSRQTQQYYDNQFGDEMNQYSLLPPIAKDDTSHTSRQNEPDKSKIKLRAQSENIYLKDRQNMAVESQFRRLYRIDDNANQDNGGYMANFVNQMSKVNQVTSYKPYTLRDYRQMKKELQTLSKVGGLGPDLDSDHVRMKAERQDRRLKYAQFVGEVNRHALEGTRGDGSPKFAQPPTEEQIRRQKLLEYARNVPKPKVKRAKPEGKPDGKQRLGSVYKQEPEDGFLTFVRVDQGNKNDTTKPRQGNVNNEEPDDGFLTFTRSDRGAAHPDQAALEEMKRRHEQDKQLAYNNASANSNSGRRSNRDADAKQVRFVGSGVGNTPKA